MLERVTAFRGNIDPTHVHLEIIERMGDAHTGFIESDHAANFSHDLHGCRLTVGSIW